MNRDQFDCVWRSAGDADGATGLGRPGTAPAARSEAVISLSQSAACPTTGHKPVMRGLPDGSGAAKLRGWRLACQHVPVDECGEQEKAASPDRAHSAT
jgi:hypothetical protein